MINPSIRESGEAKHVAYGELLVAACAEEWFGAETAMFDINALRSTQTQKTIDEDLTSAIQGEDFDLIGIGGITTTYGSIKRTLQLIRPLTDAPIVLGGGVLTSLPYEIMTWLKDYVDVGVLGEALVTIGEVMEHAYDVNFKDVEGTCYWDKNGKFVMNKERRMLPNVDIIPLPKYDLAPLDIYFKNSSILLSEAAAWATHRLDYCGSWGCSLSCRYCFDLGLTGMKWDTEMQQMVFPRSHPTTVPRTNRWRSPETIVRDWQYLHEKYGVDFIAMLDENLSTLDAVIPKQDGLSWLEQISKLCVESGLQPDCVRQGVPHSLDKCKSGIHWGGTAHASLIRPRALRAMYLSGCTYLDFGYEQWDDRMLKEIRKGSTLKTNVRSIIMSMRHGVRPVPNNITALENEDFESIRRMMVAWEVLGIVVFPFLYTPYCGADIYYRNKEKILEAYGGDLELFVKTLNDATEPVVSISKNFTLEDILVYRFHMVRGDKEAIDQFENAWRKRHGLPPRSKEEQQADWGRFKADVQKLADEAWAEKYEYGDEALAPLAYRPETTILHQKG